MAAPAVGSVLEVSFRGEVNAQKTLTVLHYAVAAQWSSADVFAFYDDVWDVIRATGLWDMETGYLNCCASNFTLESIRLQAIYPTRYRFNDYVRNVPGNYSGSCNAQNLAGVVTKRTPLTGRKQRGSCHMPALATGAYSSGLLGVGYKTVLGIWSDIMLQQVAEDGGPGLLNPCIYHRAVNANPKFDVITSATVQPQVRTERSRTYGKGI